MMTKFRNPGKGKGSRAPSRKLKQRLDAARELFEEGAGDEALRELAQLADEYPRSKPILYELLFVCYEMEDWRSLARYSERLLPMEKGRDRAITLNNLVGAYSRLFYPALAWQRARELVKRHPQFPGRDQIEAFADNAEEFLRGEAARLMPESDLAPVEKLKVLVQHDRVHFYTESGQPQQAIEAAEAVLDRVPNLVPVLNNLSLAHFTGGDPQEAIAVAERALAQAPENVHALANLTRFCFLTARFDEAEQYASRLKELDDGEPGLELKRAEALSYLGDDEGVRDAYQRVKEGSDNLPLLLLHLGAVAHFRLGNEKTAWRLWRKAVRQDPAITLAKENLADRDAPAGKRNAPWYWTLPYWMSGDFSRELRTMAERIDRAEEQSDESIENPARSLLEHNPALIQLFPHILERGDGWARQSVVNVIRIAEMPELWPVLYEFAMGRHGTDDLRLEVAHFLRDEHSEMLPPDGKVTMWVQGEQRDLRLMGFEVHDEPEPPDDVPDDVLEKSEEAYDLLVEGEAEETEPLLEEIIAAAPNYAAPYNHLAVAYEQQGRHEEARTLAEETYARFPDYLFARVKMARYAITDGRIEEAEALLAPIVRRDRLHISEFRALADAQIALAMAQGNEEAARSWLEMWAEMDEDHPGVAYWRSRLEGPEDDSAAFLNLARRLRGGSGDG